MRFSNIHRLRLWDGLVSARCPVTVQCVVYDDSVREPDVSNLPNLLHPISIVHQPASRSEPHLHEFYEVCLVCHGSALHLTEDTEEHVGAGDVVIIPPEAPHQFRDVCGLVLVNVFYVAEWLSDDLRSLWQEPGLVHLFLASSLFPGSAANMVNRCRLEDTPMRACLAELRDVFCGITADNPSRLFVRSCFLKALVVMSQSYVHQWGEGFMANYRHEIWYFLNEVEDAITKGQAFSLEECAGKTEISADRLSRIFSQAVGSSPQEYFQRRRAQHAARMLLQPEMKVTQVAHALGYADCSHFSRVFRRYFGMTPKTYQMRSMA